MRNEKQSYPSKPADRMGHLSANLITYHDPKSPAAEAFRSLRTNVGFANIDNPLKMIVVTSPSPNDGKTTVATNFATTMAKMDKRVLMIDCDLRKPKLHRAFGLSNDVGLTHILTDMVLGDNLVDSIVKPVHEIDHLWVITSGFIPPNPTEVLSSKKMENFLYTVKEKYDIVILDTPPVSNLSDAAIVGKRADGVLLVLASGQTEIETAIHAKKALMNVDANIIGAVLTKLEKGSGSRYYYYRYSNYRYYEDGNGE